MPTPPETGPSVYVHVPFCEQKCTYCDFYTITDREGIHPLAPRWMELAAQEMDLWRTAGAARLGQPIRTVFLGGGTPSLLQPAAIGDFLNYLRRDFGLLPDAEVTLETQPRTVDAAKLDAYAQAGITRFSIGVQTFDPGLLMSTGRRHSVEDARRTIRDAGATGRLVSIDLIAALPGQSLARWREELHEALSHSPSHISTYELTFHPGTRWRRDLESGRLQEADEELRIAMFEEARAILTRAGYEHYEISNFARPGFRSRHNETYWRLEDFIGLGAGAHSLIWPHRWHNPKDAGSWAAAISGGRLFRHSSDADDPEIFLAENLAMALRLTEGVDLNWFARKTGSDLREGIHRQRLEELADAGLVTFTSSRLQLTQEGQLRADSISEYLL